MAAAEDEGDDLTSEVELPSFSLSTKTNPSRSDSLGRRGRRERRRRRINGEERIRDKWQGRRKRRINREECIRYERQERRKRRRINGEECMKNELIKIED